MPAQTSRVAGTLLALALLGAPPAAHVAFMTHRAVVLASIVIAVQAVLVTWIMSSAIPQRTLRVGACGVVFLVVFFLARFASGGPVVASAVPHALAYLALLAIFAASLRPGQEPVVTSLARKSRGPLQAEIVCYTRRVTWIWCWFFLAQLLASLVLLLFASPELWSTFVNVCNLPLIGVVFCSEYAYRQWRHAARSSERLVDVLRIFRQIRAVPASRDR